MARKFISFANPVKKMPKMQIGGIVSRIPTPFITFPQKPMLGGNMLLKKKLIM